MAERICHRNLEIMLDIVGQLYKNVEKYFPCIKEQDSMAT